MMSKFKKYKYYGGEKMVRELPKVRIGDETYYIDDLLGELRNVNNPHDRRSLTCIHCLDRNECSLAWDPYNTDGDCLAMK